MKDSQQCSCGPNKSQVAQKRDKAWKKKFDKVRAEKSIFI